MFTWYLGLDLGQARDYTAAVILEQPIYFTEAAAARLFAPRSGWVPPMELSPYQIEEGRNRNYREGVPGVPPLRVPHIQRFPIGTPYPDVVDEIGRMLRRPPLLEGHTVLVVDKTGVGAPVVELFRQAGMHPVPIVITAGNVVSYDEDTGDYHVPKRDLISTVAVLLEQQRLAVTDALPDAAALKRELQTFKRKVTPQGSDTYTSWREADHDDLVLATALAAWFRQFYNTHIDLDNSLRPVGAAER